MDGIWVMLVWLPATSGTCVHQDPRVQRNRTLGTVCCPQRSVQTLALVPHHVELASNALRRRTGSAAQLTVHHVGAAHDSLISESPEQVPVRMTEACHSTTSRISGLYVQAYMYVYAFICLQGSVSVAPWRLLLPTGGGRQAVVVFRVID